MTDRTAESPLRSSWAGCSFLVELEMEEARALVVQALRQQPRSVVARALGLRRPRLDSFLAGGDVSEAEWRGIAAWCAGRSGPSIAAETVAVRLLARWLPTRERAAFRRQITDTVLTGYASRRVKLPTWVDRGLRDALANAPLHADG